MNWEFDILYAIQSIRNPVLDRIMAVFSDIVHFSCLPEESESRKRRGPAYIRLSHRGGFREAEAGNAPP